MFKIIVAYDKNLTIGYEGWMPWDLPEDLEHFKQTTLNHNLIMGSTTFNGMKSPLKNRVTYVLSTSPVVESDQVKWISDLDAFIAKHKNSDEVFYVCGGASIYKQFIDVSKELIVSLVDGDHPSDTKFPQFDESLYTVEVVDEKEGFKILNYKRMDEI